MPTPDRRLVKFRVTLPDHQVVDDIYAHSEAEAVVELERLKPGLSGQILRLERDDRQTPEGTER